MKHGFKNLDPIPSRDLDLPVTSPQGQCHVKTTRQATEPCIRAQEPRRRQHRDRENEVPWVKGE